MNKEKVIAEVSGNVILCPKYPIHLCPVCGLRSDTTGRVCTKHSVVIYNSDGYVVDYKDNPIGNGVTFLHQPNFWWFGNE